MTQDDRKLHFVIVDDDQQTAAIYARLLKKAGHEVTAFSSSTDALKHIPLLKPVAILCDLMIPELDGLELFQAVKKLDGVNAKFIILTGKIFEYDRRKSLEMGVDGYLTKPLNPETFLPDLLEIIHHRMAIQFWGVRGSLPVPGVKTIRYGGNTNCITLSFAKKHFFIFDAGTGIRELSNHLLRTKKFPITAKLFISHPHYDHINGIPFFVPFYMRGNEFEILGTSHYGLPIEKLIADQMDGVYFPVTTKEFAANIIYRNLNEETFMIDELEVRTIFLNHPGRCLGYRIQYQDKSFCYITDNELYLEETAQFNQFEVDRLVKFIEGTQLLVIDSTYADDDYSNRNGWGHSCVTRVVKIAHKANVKTFCLYHHDPDQLDDDIDEKLQIATNLLAELGSSTVCIAPCESDIIIL